MTQMKNDSLNKLRATHSGASGMASFLFFVFFFNLKSTCDTGKLVTTSLKRGTVVSTW